MIVSRILKLPARLNTAIFIGKGWRIWRGPTDGDGLTGKVQQDVRSRALREVDFSKVLCKTYLKEHEFVITGEEKLRRMKEEGVIRLNARTGKALLSEKYHKTLEWLRIEKGIDYLDFMGTELRDPRGFRSVLCIAWNDGWWHWYCLGLNCCWSGRNFSTTLAEPILPAGR